MAKKRMHTMKRKAATQVWRIWINSIFIPVRKMVEKAAPSSLVPSELR
jgi:hypothetical protein